MLVVNSELKIKTIDELIALSKAKPGTLSYLTAAPPLVLYMETLKTGAGRGLGAGAVQGRRRGGQRGAERLDADRRSSARATSSARSRPAR